MSATACWNSRTRSWVTAPSGLILRSCCVGADADDIAEDIGAMLDAGRTGPERSGYRPPETLAEGDGPHILAWRDWTDPADVVTESRVVSRHHGVLDAMDIARDIARAFAGRRASIHRAHPRAWLRWM